MDPHPDSEYDDGQDHHGASDAEVSLLPPSGNTWIEPPEQRLSYCQIAWTHKLFMLGSLIWGTFAGVAYVTFKAPVYKAVTTVEMVGFNQSFMGMSQVDPQAGTDSTTASASNIQTQTRILVSSRMLNRVVERMNPEMNPVMASPSTFFTRLRNHLPYFRIESSIRSRRALAEAAASTTARGVGASRLIEISCLSSSPEVAANFLNTLSEEHVAQTLAARSELTQKTSQWMDSQLEDAKGRLQEAGEDLRHFVQESGVDFFPEQTTLADSSLRGLQGDVTSAQADRVSKQSHWEAAKSAPMESLPDLFPDSGLQELRTQLNDLRRDKALSLVTLTPENLRVKKIQAQIDDAELAYGKEKQGVLQRLQNELEQAQRREKLLTVAYNSQARTVSSQSDMAAQYSMLKRSVDMAQQLYNALLLQSTQAALVALAPSSSIRVVDAAAPAATPSSPAPAANIPTGTLLGGAVGYGLLVLLERRQRTKVTHLFDAPGHAQHILGVPELGVIPSATSGVAAKSTSGWKPGRGMGRDPAELLLGEATSDKALIQPGIATWRGSKSSLLAESFRQTLVSILRSRLSSRSPIYVITSAGPAEGKTTMSANLAVAMAESGQRVLLVDADLRRDKAHMPFVAQQHRGLSDILAAAEPVDTLALRDYLQPTGVENLQVLTSGLKEVETPALLFFSPRLQDLARLLREHFDTILVDTAPALAFPDARLWGKCSDGVVLVIRSGLTTREGASSACQRFLDDGVPVLGSILNDWEPRVKSTAGYHMYSYSSQEKKPPNS